MHTRPFAQHNHAAFITINAPAIPKGATALIYDGSEKPVTVTFSDNFESLIPVFFEDSEVTLDVIQGNVHYYTNGDKTAEPSEDAITDAGTHIAELLFKGQTASVEYTIAPASISSVSVMIDVPAATSILETAAKTSTANVTLNDSGAITWDPAAPQDGKAAYATTYKATVTATAAANYAFADNVSATVNGNVATVTKNQDGTLSISCTFPKTALTPVMITAADQEVTYSAEGIAIPVEGMFTIPEGVGEATYSVANGTGTGTYDGQTGRLTVTACGTFTVSVSTAETDTHAVAENSATLTVNTKAMDVSAEDVTVTVDGQPHGITVNVTDPASGATVKYGTAEDNYTLDASPTQTEVGMKTVYYRVMADNYTTYTGSATVTINPVDKTALNVAIADAETYYNSIKDKAEYSDIVAMMKKAIDTAKAAAENGNLADGDVKKAIDDVNAAVETAKSDVTVVDKQLADAAAAKAVTDKISALPSTADASDKAAVEAARKAYDALTEDQKKLVSADTVKKLTDAEAQVKAAEEAAQMVDIATCTIIVKNQIYTGKTLKPALTVKNGETTLTVGTDYTVAYKNNKNVGTATVTVTGIGNYTGSTKATFKIVKASIAKCNFTVKDRVYNGKVKKPAVTVTLGKVKLKMGTDYTVTYKNNKNVGTATVTVKGKGNFKGSKTLFFKINPKGTAFLKLTGGNRQIALKWKRQKNITGYQIQYSLKKDFTGSKTVKIKKAKTLTTTIKKLKANKKYYVRIRTYTTVKKKTYYSAWSEAKAVKIKGTAANEAVRKVETTMNVGNELDLKALLPDVDFGSPVTCVSSDESVVMVSDEGIAYAKSLR